jgi:ribosomal protein L7/L12
MNNQKNIMTLLSSLVSDGHTVVDCDWATGRVVVTVKPEVKPVMAPEVKQLPDYQIEDLIVADLRANRNKISAIKLRRSLVVKEQLKDSKEYVEGIMLAYGMANKGEDGYINFAKY